MNDLDAVNDLDTVNDLGTVLAGSGLTGWVHARNIDSGAEIGIDADTPVVAASVFKVPILVEFYRQVAAGELDPQHRVRVGAHERRTPGGTGLSILSDDVEISVRDCVVLMMSISDNRATDLVLDLVGRERVNTTMAASGFPGTVLEADCQELFDQIDADLGRPWDESVADADLRAVRALDPATTNRTTPRETTGLLAALWRDELFAEPVCAHSRDVLGLQFAPHRIASGFAGRDVRISGKTGTLAFVRSEAGVVEYRDAGRFAMAVFVRSETAAPRNPQADQAIGRLARRALDALQE